MEQHPSSSFRLASLGILAFAALGTVLASAKWGISLFAWISPFCYLYFFRIIQVKRKLLWAFPFLAISAVLSTIDVVPFPLPVLLILSIIAAAKAMIIYFLDKWITQKAPYFLATLFFPSAFVSLEFLHAKLGGGVWWSIANSQFSFHWLSQLASITGLWGISFLIYWFASVAVWAIRRNLNALQYRAGLMIYGIAFLLVSGFGAIRYHFSELDNKHCVKVAGLSVPLMHFMENLYKDYCGKDVTIDPKTSISSPKLQEINKAEQPFIENADSIKFRNAFKSMQQVNDSLFILSQMAADRGAKIIIWSEANGLVFKYDESRIIERGKKFAALNKVYLLMAIAVIHSGKITAGAKFLENEAVLLSPLGQILTVFHKNNPVPMVEASVPGDGIIPVTETPYGRIATSICYDADFPAQMRQLGKKKADLLLLPSGDWYAICHYHSQMATYRGIENGTSIIRQASGGISQVSDYRGKIQASLDFFGPGIKLWTAEIPVGHVSTLYTFIGDSFAYSCCIASCIGLFCGLVISFKKQESLESALDLQTRRPVLAK